jgi:hypothetical protein
LFLRLPQVHIEPGHRHGSKVLFRGEAGADSPDVLPGDLIFILEQVGGLACTRGTHLPQLCAAVNSYWSKLQGFQHGGGCWPAYLSLLCAAVTSTTVISAAIRRGIC